MQRIIFKYKILILALLMTVNLFGGEFLTCKEQKNIFLKFSTIKVTGGKQTLRYNTRTGKMFLDKEYSSKSTKTQSLRFKNMTNSRYKRAYKVYPSNGWATINIGLTANVSNFNQVQELLSCKYDVKKIQSWDKRYPTYEFYRS